MYNDYDKLDDLGGGDNTMNLNFLITIQEQLKV